MVQFNCINYFANYVKQPSLKLIHICDIRFIKRGIIYSTQVKWGNDLSVDHQFVEYHSYDFIYCAKKAG
jgi:hypothetical protein